MKNNFLAKKTKLGVRMFFFSFFFLSFFLMFSVAGSSLAQSASTYQNQEKIPGKDSTGDLITYLENIYSFGIAIAGILAVVMISLGAFFYIVTAGGNSSKMLDAKEMITEAVFGLILALVAYLLLFVINPDLISGTVTAPTNVIN